MTWKSYTVVSGATVLAGWLASTPPANAPAGTAVAVRQARLPVSAASSDIEQQATRLQARLNRERVYLEPARNPFRFAVRQPAAGPAPAAAVAASAPPVAVAPALPRLSLAGIAEDTVNGRMDRTAVVSGPEGVLLVREGQEILGRYRVARIESEAVDLVGLADGETRRLRLGR